MSGISPYADVEPGYDPFALYRQNGNGCLALSHCTWANTNPFIPSFELGKVIKVYDGDTITVAAELSPGSGVNRFSVRLFGVDAPEIRSSDMDEKHCAKTVRDELARMLLEKIVHLDITNIDKYGRLLARVRYEGEDVSDWLLSRGYAVKYHGKTKKSPPCWSDFIKNKQTILWDKGRTRDGNALSAMDVEVL
jgi:micrococcal nuclease